MSLLTGFSRDQAQNYLKRFDMTTPLLKVKNLSVCVKDKQDKQHKIVNNISFDIKPGEVIALIGAVSYTHLRAHET